MPVVRRYVGEQIHANGVFEVAGIEICEVVGSLRWNVVQQFFGEIAVRINDAYTVAERDVLDDEISKKGGFAGARFSDDVYMLALVFFGYTKTLGVAPAVAFSDDDAWF